MCVIVWFRNDLRLLDHPALYRACQEHEEVIALYLYSPEEEGAWPIGGASKAWLHRSLQKLQDDLNGLGIPLLYRKGNAVDELEAVIQEVKASALFWNRRYDPKGIEVDTKVKAHFKRKGVDTRSFSGNYLIEPPFILNKQEKPFQVFTPFWKKIAKEEMETVVTKPPKRKSPPKKNNSLTLEELMLLPKVHWDRPLFDYWEVGEAAALKKFHSFLEKALLNYHDARNYPAIKGISTLSPHLHFGEISPRYIWQEVLKHYSFEEEGAECFLRELGWREFANYLLFHFPHTTLKPLQERFSHFPWVKDEEKLRRWQQGKTGYPIVDAGMRELWQTGFMHNRVRMIVGSFLVKDLLISWVEGAKWFFDTLVDADLASNTLGWQWVAGCGADAAPFFRIFNPVVQGEKFDPEALYIKKWVPELRTLTAKEIHGCVNVEIKKGDYPTPIVDHAWARERALNIFKKLKEE